MEQIIFSKNFGDGQYIRAHQTVELVERYPGAGKIEIRGLKYWEGEINIKEELKDWQADIGDYFQGYKGEIFLLGTLKTGLIEFRGNGPLYFEGKEIL
jgi:hypothetical protein